MVRCRLKMKLGELKKSLTRFPPDMDDVEVVVQFVGLDGKADSDLLVYIGYAPLSDTLSTIALGTWKALDKRVAEGKAPELKNYRPHPDNKSNANTDTQNEES